MADRAAVERRRRTVSGGTRHRHWRGHPSLATARRRRGRHPTAGRSGTRDGVTGSVTAALGQQKGWHSQSREKVAFAHERSPWTPGARPPEPEPAPGYNNRLWATGPCPTAADWTAGHKGNLPITKGEQPPRRGPFFPAPDGRCFAPRPISYGMPTPALIQRLSGGESSFPGRAATGFAGDRGWREGARSRTCPQRALAIPGKDYRDYSVSW